MQLHDVPLSLRINSYLDYPYPNRKSQGQYEKALALIGDPGAGVDSTYMMGH